MKTKIALTLIAALLFLQCGPSKKTKDLMTQAKSLFGTIPEKMPGSENDTPAMVELGKKLYFEKRLSVNDQQSCNTCHLLGEGQHGVDNKVTSPGAKPGTLGDRNSPSVLNAGYHLAQFWDGRSKDLAAQAKGPILNPVEMGMPSEKAVIDKLSKIQDYVDGFKKAFPSEKEPMTYDNLAKAIAAFERTQRTYDRLDDFINGDHKALTEAEQEGMRTFVASGCTTCHMGPMMGGTFYRKMGQVNAYANTEDTGRFKVTKKPEDKYMFKVPSLRNVANTAPYFHDGSAKTLEEAVKQMAYLQLNIKLSEDKIAQIVTFLKATNNKKSNTL